MGVRKTGFTIEQYEEYGPWAKQTMDEMTRMIGRVQKAFGKKAKLAGLAKKASLANSAFFHALREAAEKANPNMHPPEIRKMMGYEDRR